MRFTELPVTITCNNESLVGVLSVPEQSSPRAVVIVPGAPQYRIGSHRQFVLLARELAETGFPTLRFDYRGTGDSDGDFVGFENIDDDIRAAVDMMFEKLPGLADVVLWGLCDGASAVSFYAARGDQRISRLVIVNPWVRSDVGLAQTRLKRYYAARLASLDFWRKLFAGRLALWRSITDLLSAVSIAARFRKGPSRDDGHGFIDSGESDLSAKVSASLCRFHGPVLIVLCGADITAQEFHERVIQTKEMYAWLNGAQNSLCVLEPANHTYSRRNWRAQVHTWTTEWLKAQ